MMAGERAEWLHASFIIPANHRRGHFAPKSGSPATASPTVFRHKMLVIGQCIHAAARVRNDADADIPAVAERAQLF